jgi:hypothetical protein
MVNSFLLYDTDQRIFNRPFCPGPISLARSFMATPFWIWIFYLNPIDERTTRLVIRSRLVYEPSLGHTLMWRVFTDPISFVMERKMLQGIKVRTESGS